jgi:hypothetical protein
VPDEPDLFDRATRAVLEVKTLQGEIAVRRAELKKKRAEAAALKREVMEALRGVRKPRGSRKKKAEQPAGTCEHGVSLLKSCADCLARLPQEERQANGE